MKSESMSYVKQEKIVPYQLIHPKGFSNNNILPDHQWIVNSIFASAWRFNEKKNKDTSSENYLRYLRENVSHPYKDNIVEEKIIEIPNINFYNQENYYFKCGNYEVSVTHFSSTLIEQQEDSLFCLVIRIRDESLFECMEYAFSNYIPNRVTWPTQTFNRRSRRNQERFNNNIKPLCIPNVFFFPVTKPIGNGLNIVNQLEDKAQEVIRFEKMSIESNKSNTFWEWPSEYCTWKYQEQYINAHRKFLKLSNEEKTKDESSNGKKKWSLNHNLASVDIDLMTGGGWSMTRLFPTISYTEQSTIVNSNLKLNNFKLLIIVPIIILIGLLYFFFVW